MLSTVTREAMEQRLRVLETVQNQILLSMQILTQVLSVIPVTPSANATETEPQSTAGTQAAAETAETAETQVESSSSLPDTDTSTSLIELSDNEEEMSSRRREKMPSGSLDNNEATDI